MSIGQSLKRRVFLNTVVRMSFSSVSMNSPLSTREGVVIKIGQKGKKNIWKMSSTCLIFKYEMGLAAQT